MTGSATAKQKVTEELLNPIAYGAPYVPRGVHAREPSYDPEAYWRGSVWPQLRDLLCLATRRMLGEDSAGAKLIAASTVRGALASGFSEYLNGHDVSGFGVAPESWTGLALLIDRRRALPNEHQLREDSSYGKMAATGRWQLREDSSYGKLAIKANESRVVQSRVVEPLAETLDIRWETQRK